MVQEIVPENDLRSLPPRAALYARFRSEMSPEAIPARCHLSLSTRKPWLGSNRLKNLAQISTAVQLAKNY